LQIDRDAVAAHEHGLFAAHVPFLSCVVAHLGGSLVQGDFDEQTPEIAGPGHAKPILGSTAQKAGQGRLDHVLGIDALAQPRQPGPHQAKQTG
jgi:hypothetical protein